MTDWKTMPGALLSIIERRWLKRAAEHISSTFPNPLILEIGVDRGASMHCLRAGAPKATLVGIGVFIKKVQSRDILAAELIGSDSRQMGPKWNQPIHLLFIDGGHQYETVRADILNFGKHVVVGGIIAFHDYSRSEKYLKTRKKKHPKRPPLGVRKAVDELCTPERGWEPITIVDSIGYAIRRTK